MHGVGEKLRRLAIFGFAQSEVSLQWPCTSCVGGRVGFSCLLSGAWAWVSFSDVYAAQDGRSQSRAHSCLAVVQVQAKPGLCKLPQVPVASL